MGRPNERLPSNLVGMKSWSDFFSNFSNEIAWATQPKTINWTFLTRFYLYTFPFISVIFQISTTNMSSMAKKNVSMAKIRTPLHIDANREYTGRRFIKSISNNEKKKNFENNCPLIRFIRFDARIIKNKEWI